MLSDDEACAVVGEQLRRMIEEERASIRDFPPPDMESHFSHASKAEMADILDADLRIMVVAKISVIARLN